MLLLLAAYTLRISMKGASTPSSSPGLYAAVFGIKRADTRFFHA